MLQPEDRSILIDDLRPPAGHRLAGAVATTFTLDLTTAILPTLAFSSIAASTPKPDPVSALEAVRLAAEKVDVFCQAGCIAIPVRASALLAFVEPMVHGVRSPQGGLFHPKVWFVKYLDEDGGTAYRLLVLTRNLTNDRSWDVAVRLDSQDVSIRPLPVNDPLGRLLADLPGRSIARLPQPRRQRVMDLAEEARHVVWGLPKGADEFGFHYLPDQAFDMTGARHLVVAPFLNDAGLDRMLAKSPGAVVVSRPEELERLSPDRLADLQTYILSAVPELDAEAAAEDEAPAAKAAPYGLHAKLYVVEPHGRARRARLLIGSANATEAAVTTNVEFLVEFTGARRAFGVDTLVGAEGILRPLVEEYIPVGGQPPETDEDERRSLDNCLRSIAEIPHSVEVIEPSARGTSYELTAHTTKAYPLKSGWSASIELITRPGVSRPIATGGPVEATFGDVAKADITPFLCVRVTADKALAAGTVVLADLVNDPIDRLDVVLAAQIDTREKFLRFVRLLLSLGSPQVVVDVSGGERSGDAWRIGPGSSGILELALRALVYRPQAIDDLDRLVRRLETTPAGTALLPVGFLGLWTQVREARRRVAR